MAKQFRLAAKSTIADAEITYTGKGAASTASRPGIVMRFINWLF